MCMRVHGLQCVCGRQRTLWSWPSPSIFTWAPGTELRCRACAATPSPLSRLDSPCFITGAAGPHYVVQVRFTHHQTGLAFTIPPQLHSAVVTDMWHHTWPWFLKCIHTYELCRHYKESSRVRLNIHVSEDEVKHGKVGFECGLPHRLMLRTLDGTI